jgi:hypothetical protein
MDFASPRFQGDEDLLRILNDPDTGTEKLGPGSPPAAVGALQRALFDLGWTLRIDPPFPDETQFVIGEYGPTTTRTVLAYKTHFDLRFPPNDPNGIIGPSAGPQHPAAADRQCVLLDASIAAIEAKAEALRADGIDVVLDMTPPATGTILGTDGAMRLGQVGGEIAALWHLAELGAFEVHGPIAEAYVSRGHARGRLGFPTSDVFQEGPVRPALRLPARTDQARARHRVDDRSFPPD